MKKFFLGFGIFWFSMELIFIPVVIPSISNDITTPQLILIWIAFAVFDSLCIWKLIKITKREKLSPQVQLPKKKTKTTSLLLCIFLGIFGIHRFYVGKILSGIIYFFTIGVFGIGWIVDIILIATNRFKDSKGNIITDYPIENSANQTAIQTSSEQIPVYQRPMQQNTVPQTTANNSVHQQSIVNQAQTLTMTQSFKNALIQDNDHSFSFNRELIIITDSLEVALHTTNINAFKASYELLMEQASQILRTIYINKLDESYKKLKKICEDTFAMGTSLITHFIINFETEYTEKAKQAKTANESIKYLQYAYDTLQKEEILHNSPIYKIVCNSFKDQIESSKKNNIIATDCHYDEVDKIKSNTPMYDSTLLLQSEFKILQDSFNLILSTKDIEEYKQHYELANKKAEFILQTINENKQYEADHNNMKSFCENVPEKSQKSKFTFLLRFVTETIESAKSLPPYEAQAYIDNAYRKLRSTEILRSSPIYEQQCTFLLYAKYSTENLDKISEYIYDKEAELAKEYFPDIKLKQDNYTQYSRFKPDHSQTIEEISEAAKEHSFAMHYLHQQEYAKFDPYNLDTSIADDLPLTSVEKAFLKYINGKNVCNPDIAGYWTYEYNINYTKVLTKCLINKYLVISSGYDALPFLTVEELKAILRSSNQKISGKKAELIDRIKDYIPEDIVSACISDANKRYILSDTGIDIVSTVKDSITKNTDLEDECLTDILNLRFAEAYKKICDNELSKNIHSDFSDLNYEQKYGLSAKKTEYYTELMQTDDIRLPDVISPEHYNAVKACVILGIMFGTTSDKIYLLFCRVTGEEYNKTILTVLLQRLQFAFIRNTPVSEITNEIN